MQQNIQRASANRSGVRFGGVSTALITADVALAVATVGVAAGLSDRLTEAKDGMGIEADRYLSAELRLPRTDPAPKRSRSDRD